MAGSESYASRKRQKFVSTLVIAICDKIEHTLPSHYNSNTHDSMKTL